jgi:chromosome segregation ATPase
VPDDDVEARFTRLEHEVAELREQVALTRSDAAAARVLAAGADRDVSEVRAELRAHTQGLNALRETQLEQSRALGEQRQEINGLRHEMREGFTSQGQRIDELEREMRGGFATMATGMAQITALLTDIRGPEHDGN